MAKKDAGAKKRRKTCSKIDIYSDEPVFSRSDKFFIREKSDCIQKSGDTHSSGETRKQAERKLRIRRSVEFSNVTVQDAYFGGLMDTATVKPVATKEESGDVDLSESETGSEEDVTGKPVAYETAAGKPCAPNQSACQERPKAEKTEWSHNLQVSPATILL